MPQGIRGWKGLPCSPKSTKQFLGFYVGCSWGFTSAKCDEAVPCRYYWPGFQRVLRHNTQSLTQY